MCGYGCVLVNLVAGSSLLYRMDEVIGVSDCVRSSFFLVGIFFGGFVCYFLFRGVFRCS